MRYSLAAAWERVAAFLLRVDEFAKIFRFVIGFGLLTNFSVHPATRLVVWLLLLVGIQGFSGVGLLAVCLLLPFLGARILRRGGALVWRTRWLLLSLLLIFSWGVAGEPLWAGPLAPTREGTLEALTHLGRLVFLLIAVAAFLEITPLPEMLAGAHALLKPWQRFGCDPDRSVIRLMLVLRYVETLPRPRDWRTLLDVPAITFCETLEVNHQPVRWWDCLMMLGAALAVVLFLSR